ncbi:hypothetical protein E4U54_006379 [Claviceps lovelessii]|nr:hypothetical protein E4U54_006379 [Claviceps lovelessii]
MCGRYALSLRASQIRQMLQDDNVAVDDAVDDEGPDAPRQSYNFAPGYHGVVYRADTPDWGAGPRSHSHSHGRGHHDRDDAGDAGDDDDAAAHEPNTKQAKYKLQSMKWGLVPSWTKRSPDYQTLMRTINCRDDSLSNPGGMWTSMKNKKRCVVLAQGFFEWLKTGPRDKQPHYVTRPDGRLMCFAGLWDCVQYENGADDTKLYTYTIITTDANPQLRFLHDRMPVILEPGSDDMRRWVDPGRWAWSRELQALLRPFEGPLRVYPVKKEVGKVGNDSPLFIVPLDSKENKSNIANFFSSANAKAKTKVKEEEEERKNNKDEEEVGVQALQQGSFVAERQSRSEGEGEDDDDVEVSTHDTHKRKMSPTESRTRLPSKKVASASQRSRPKISSTKNEHKSPKKSTTAPGSRKITSFFGNSA